MAEWITTENIPAEAWRRVLEFANIDFAIDAITHRHGLPANKSIEENYKKQAEQVRVSILQSKEYFEAASSASLFTSPNHLYYGMVSLAAAIMLIRGSGEESLDYLRKDKQNRAHGLIFNTAVTKNNCQKYLSILNSSYVEVVTKGFFLNWHKTLPLNVNNYAEIKTFKDGVSITNRKIFGSEITNTSKEIVGKKDTILNLMGRLPDMLRSLARYGHSIPFSRADYRVLDKDNKKTLEWIMHGASNPIDLQAILKMFKYKYSCREQWECSDYEGRSGCIVKWMEPNKNSADMRIQFPSMREDLNNEYYAYAENLDTHEIVDIYRIAFGLSMLSRYYPDFWVRCLDSHCIAAKAIEHFVFVMIRKFPVLSLRHLTGEDVVISNQRPPWLISLRG